MTAPRDLICFGCFFCAVAAVAGVSIPQLLQLGEDNSAPLVAAAGCDEAWQGGKAAAAAAADIFHGLLCSPLLLQVLSEMINMLHSTGEIVAAAAAGASTTESAVGGHQQDQHSGSVSTAAVHRHSNGLVLAAAALTRCLQGCNTRENQVVQVFNRANLAAVPAAFCCLLPLSSLPLHSLELLLFAF